MTPLITRQRYCYHLGIGIPYFGLTDTNQDIRTQRVIVDVGSDIVCLQAAWLRMKI